MKVVHESYLFEMPVLSVQYTNLGGFIFCPPFAQFNPVAGTLVHLADKPSVMLKLPVLVFMSKLGTQNPLFSPTPTTSSVNPH